jgi:hypothetical protein
MAELKTKPTARSVEAFLQKVKPGQREDCRTLLRIMKNATGDQPTMWGPSIVGFGSYHYKYDSGREGDWFVAGFAPRKTDLTLYIVPGVDDFRPLLAKLGPHTTGKSCLYIKRLGDVDLAVLEDIVSASVNRMRPSTRATRPGKKRR